MCIKDGCPYLRLSKNAIDKQATIQTRTDETLSGYSHIRREHIQLLISVPLISKENIVGVLTLGTKKSDPLDQTNLELLTAICHQVGMAIENAYLYQESELWASELSMLHKASINLGSTLDASQINEEIVYQSARLTGRQMACVIYWDEHCEKFEIVSSVGMKPEVESFLIKNPTACELLDELCKTRKSIVIDDIRQDARIPESWKTGLDIRSLFCSPIWGIDEPVEFLFIMDQRHTNSWRSKDVELVESFISRAAVALENANLYDQLEWAATLEERQRIAADMHDGLAQTISLLGFKVDNAAELLPSESAMELVEALKGVRETVSQASVDARKSISSLQTMPQPRKSLQEILTTIIEQCSDGWSNGGASVFHTSFSFSEPLFLSERQITQVVPIIQEALINARKHSDATQLQIQVQQSNGQVSITIEDDGKGFDVDNLSDQEENHFGIKIMRARATRLGGELQIISKPGHGTTVTLSWMLNRKREGVSRHSAHTRSPAVESETYA
jgi:signal transduction histidine kinase